MTFTKIMQPQKQGRYEHSFRAMNTYIQFKFQAAESVVEELIDARMKSVRLPAGLHLDLGEL